MSSSDVLLKRLRRLIGESQETSVQATSLRLDPLRAINTAMSEHGFAGIADLNAPSLAVAFRQLDTVL